MAALTASAATQCFPTWQPGLGIPGVDGSVRAATAWDPDGAGPANPLAVLGGEFLFAGEYPLANVTAWLPQIGQFVNLSSLGGRVSALLTLPTGDLVAGGAFPGTIARFDGLFGWQTVGSGFDAEVQALAVLPNGDLVAGGDFLTAFGVGSCNHVARWNGSTWQPLGTGTDLRVRALTALPNGDLIAGGDFTTAGGTPCSRIARWNGTTWSPLGSGTGGAVGANISVGALATLGNGDVVTGGWFTTAGGVPVNRLARWNGSAWSAFSNGSGADGVVFACHVAANGDLLIAGGFTQVDGVAAPRVARWNGTTWSSLGGGGPELAALAVTTLPNGDVYLGGQFHEVASTPASNVARWNGTAWSRLGSGTDGGVGATLTTANGDLVVGGSFLMVEGVVARRIARRIGGSWTPLGSGMTHTTTGCQVAAIVELPNGDLVAGGTFSHAGGVAATNVARWNGTSWAPLGAGLPIGVLALLVLPNGELIAGGSFFTAYGAPADLLARWNGSAWTPLGGSFSSPWYGNVARLALLPNGDLVAGGVFTAANGVATENLARWDGSMWHAFGQPMSPWSRIGALAVAANGDLLAGGTFTSIGGTAANYIARWNGLAWAGVGALQPNTASSVWVLGEMPDGDVLAGGYALKSYGLSCGLVRFDGTYWQTAWSPAGSVGAMALTSDGDLAVGGGFTTGSHAAYFALLRTPCAATATPFGAGCTGSGGANTLAATSLPWTGSTFRSVATGMPAPAFALGVFGFSTISIPMPSILPQGVAGCTLLVSPDLLELYVPAAGVVQTQLVIPNTVALAGAVFHQQVVPIELSGTGDITALTGTNALTLTVGSF